MFSMMLFLFLGFCAIIALQVFFMFRQERTNKKIIASVELLSDFISKATETTRGTNKPLLKPNERLIQEANDLLDMDLDKPAKPKTPNPSSDLDINF